MTPNLPYHPDQPTSDDARARWLAHPPRWRGAPPELVGFERTPPMGSTSLRRGEDYVSSHRFGEAEQPGEVARINMALLLRRPLLVTGDPGMGKSTLAYHVAARLGLGEPLRWSINSRTILQDGLYAYDAVGHLRTVQQEKSQANLGAFITLGPLGTALLPTTLPRVLLVDELDKASFDLPNDLLHAFEEGEFRIPELIREGAGTARVVPFDAVGEEQVTVTDGRVRTLHHPVVVITSNGEREFPRAFLRRCVGLELRRPAPDHLVAIVRRLVGEVDEVVVKRASAAFEREATDVFLQALFLTGGSESGLAEAMRGLRRS